MARKVLTDEIKELHKTNQWQFLFDIISQEMSYIDRCVRNAAREVVAPSHSGAIDLCNNIKTELETEDLGDGLVEAKVTVTFKHPKPRNTLSKYKHDPVDLMYLFNNGWKNSSLIIKSKDSIDQSSRWSHSRWSAAMGNYPGDGFMTEIEDKLKHKFPNYKVALLPGPTPEQVYKKPVGR